MIEQTKIEPTMQRLNLKSLFIKAALSAAFFLILFASIPSADFRMHLNRIDPFFLTLSLLVIPVVIPTNALKWKLLIEQQGQPVSFYYLLRVYCIGYFFSNLLPSNVGGDVTRAYYLGRRLNNKSLAAISVFIERLSGMMMLMILAITAPLLQPSLYRHGYIYLPALGALFFLMIILRMGRMDNPFRLTDKLVSRFVSPLCKTSHIFTKIYPYWEKLLLKIRVFHKKLMDAIRYLKNNTPLLVRIIMLTIFFYGMTWINIYVSFRAFGVHPDFIAICAVTPAAMLVAMAPVTMLGNLGFTEGVYVVFFSLIGIDPSACLAMSMLLRFKMLLMGALGLVFYVIHRRQ